MKSRLLIPLVCYGIFALLATFTLTGKVRLLLYVLLGAFALKTWLGTLQERE